MSVAVKNTVTGVISYVPEHYLEHPILGENLVSLDAEVVTKKETKPKEQVAPEETITEEKV